MVELALLIIANFSKLSEFSHLILVIYTEMVSESRQILTKTRKSKGARNRTRQVIRMVSQQKTTKDHKLVGLLAKHSDIVKFILKLRPK